MVYNDNATEEQYVWNHFQSLFFLMNNRNVNNPLTQLQTRIYSNKIEINKLTSKMKMPSKINNNSLNINKMETFQSDVTPSVERLTTALYCLA